MRRKGEKGKEKLGREDEEELDWGGRRYRGVGHRDTEARRKRVSGGPWPAKGKNSARVRMGHAGTAGCPRDVRQPTTTDALVVATKGISNERRKAKQRLEVTRAGLRPAPTGTSGIRGT